MKRIRNTDVWPSNYRTGMWAWLAHRITGVVIVVYAAVHLWVISNARVSEGAGFDRLMETFDKPYVKVLELLLIAVILYHALNGVRLLLFDLGIGVKAQKQLFMASMAAWAIAVGFAAYFFWPLMAG